MHCSGTVPRRFSAAHFRMEKKFLSQKIPSFIPARLVEGKSRWHIVYTYTNGITGEVIRLKPTFNLNRIKSITERRRTGNRIVREINSRLPLGWPWKIVARDQATVLSVTPLRKAVEKANELKCVGKSRRTVESYGSMADIFLTHVETKYGEMTIGEFEKKHAQSFLDYLTTERKTRRGKPLSARSYNHYLNLLKGIWAILISREYIIIDVWAEFKERKITEKIARNYSKKELTLIIREVAKTDKWLMLAVVLLYYCFIRPTEITKLRCRMMRIVDGRINLPGAITKNSKNRSPTIPDNMIDYLKSFNFEKHGGHCYVFGRKTKRAKEICITSEFPVSYKVFNNRLKKILESMHKRGMIDSIENLTFYGLKDTGGQDLIDQGIDVWQLMKQFGHQSLKQTQIYLERKRVVNPAVKAHQTNLLDL